MDLFCPDCRALLNVVDAQNATCAGHDGRYQVLFNRDSPSAGYVPDMPSTVIDNSLGIVSLNLTPQLGPRVDGIFCAQHAEVPAVTRCRVCSNGVCATCDFLLPGNIHVCPACLEQEPSTEISGPRKTKMVGGLLIAAYCTFMFAMLMSGALHRAFGNDEATNTLIGNAILWPAIIGFVVALTALDRRLRNSAAIWVGVVWNGINLSLFIVLMIIGLSRG